MVSDHPRVLAVEDDKPTRVFLRHTLNDFCDPSVVESKDEALEKIDSKSFDLVLLDINLSSGEAAFPSTEEGGVKLLKAIRERPHQREVPVVAITAYAMPDDRERLLSEGFDEYVSKPFTIEELQDTISEVLPDS